jgi:hypothetical protein
MHQEFAHRLGKPWFELRAFSYLPYGHSRVGRESLPNRKRPGRRSWDDRLRLERRSRPSRRRRWANGFVGKGLPTYKYLSRFTLAESANDFRQVRYAV